MTRLTLISNHLCPYVQRAAIALLEKGAQFERVTVDLAYKPDWFLALSPLGKVPLLRVREGSGAEAVLFESSVICEYIEETQDGARLHPDNPLERARHRAWMEFGSTILSDVWVLETTPEPVTFAGKRDQITGKFGRLEAVLSDGPYFAGDRFSLVDAVYAPIFRYFDVFDTLVALHMFDSLPKVSRWRAALSERPSVRSAVGPDYGDRLRAFLVDHDAYLLKAASGE
jgi:glutathione S-transferase